MTKSGYLWWCCAGNNQRKGSFPGPCGGNRHMVLIAHATYAQVFDYDDLDECRTLGYNVCSNHKDELIERTT